MTEAIKSGRDDLLNWQPRHETFVGIDSDGCVFDTMEIKQKRCFHGLIISHWGLEAVAELVRETAEFTNLYSTTRGQNRFLTLIRTFDLLRERPPAQAAGVTVPELPELRRFADSGIPLGNPQLERAVAETGSVELQSLLDWSLAVNRRVEELASDCPPFAWALKSLDRIHAHSDAVCVSQTPAEALIREWSKNGIAGRVAVIAGQELGTKAEHLAMATRDRYDAGRVLMIGDAPGDKRAAQANSARFYPINPGHEEASWERFHEEAYDRFLQGTYAGDYETQVIAEFEALLPETPPWVN